MSGFPGVVKSTSNRAPILNPAAVVTGIDTPVTVTLPVVDPDGDPLLFGIGTPLPGTIQSFAPDAGIFVWLPPVGVAGSFTIPVSVTDGFGTAVTGAVTINVATAQIVVSPSGTVTTTESGGQSTFAVSLSSSPAGTVTLPISSNRPDEVLASPSTLTFTAADWSSARTVVLTGQADGVTDGNQTCQIRIGPAVGPGTTFDGLSAVPVSVVNHDQDQPSLVITESAAATRVAEGGFGDSYTVALAVRPSGTVTVAITHDPQLHIGSASLTFTPATWKTPQTVTVASVDDLLSQGSRSAFIVHTANGGGYTGMPSRSLAVAVADDDRAALVVSPSSLTVSELGAAAQIKLSLASQPATAVTVACASSDTNVATCAAGSLTFTPSTWNIPQFLTVAGIDDGNVEDGNRPFSASMVASGDTGYAGLSASVAGVCLDEDGKNLLIGTSGILLVTEGSEQAATYTLRLSRAPSAPVTVTLTNPDGRLVVSPTSVDFTDSTWHTPQTVIVRAFDDAIARGLRQATINHAWISTDLGYTSGAPLALGIVVVDNDTAGVSVWPSTGLVTSETGGSSSFSVRLLSEPLTDVTIPLGSSDPDQAVAGTAALTFTSSTWNQTQTVTVSGRDGNAYDDGDLPFAILVGSASSAGDDYGNRFGKVVSGLNLAVDNAPTIAAPTTAKVDGATRALITLGSERVLVVDQGQGTISVELTGISNGQAGETQAVSVTASSDAPALTGTPVVLYQDPQSIGQLRISPETHATGSAWITVQVSDGGSQEPAVTMFRLIVRPGDSAPRVDRVTSAVVAYHGAFPVAGMQSDPLVPGQLACSDAETSAAELSISLMVPPERGSLQLWQPGGETWSNLGLGDTFTQQDVDLGYVRYLHTDNTGTLNDGFQFAARDAVNKTVVGVMGITIDPRKPAVELLPSATIAYQEGDDPVAVAAVGTLVNSVATLSGGNLSISASHGDSGDLLSLRSGGNISVVGADVAYGALRIATVAGGGASLVITFEASATSAMAEEVLRQIVFVNRSDNPSPTRRTIAATLTNSLGFTSEPATKFLSMMPVNDPPTASVAPVVTVAGFASSGVLQLADVDGPPLTVTVQSAPMKGELVLGDSTTGAFTYRAWPGLSGPDSFVLSVSDGAVPVAGIVTVTVPVAITGPATLSRLWIFSRPPVEALAGDVLRWRIKVDAQDLANPNLEYSIGNAPPGLTIMPDPTTSSADVSWSIPATLTGHSTFSLMVADRVSGTAAGQTVTIFVHPRPGGTQ